MFTLMWRFFPGPVWVRIIVMLLLLVAVVLVTVTYIYPWVLTLLPVERDGVVG